MRLPLGIRFLSKYRQNPTATEGKVTVKLQKEVKRQVTGLTRFSPFFHKLNKNLNKKKLYATNQTRPKSYPFFKDA